MNSQLAENLPVAVLVRHWAIFPGRPMQVPKPASATVPNHFLRDEL